MTLRESSCSSGSLLLCGLLLMSENCSLGHLKKWASIEHEPAHDSEVLELALVLAKQRVVSPC